jgi:phosphotriesterase-related protein
VAASAGILRAWPELYGGQSRLRSHVIGVLTQARQDGVGTIVDATTFDLGRDVQLLSDVSTASGLGIIASTGHWLNPSATMVARTSDQLAELFIRELTVGADGTEIRAGAIKVAGEDSITPFEEKALIAAARANLVTGAPILTHTAARHRTGEKQADILEKAGVDPSRVVIGHSDDSAEVDYLVGLAKRGYWIGFDRIPSGALPEYGPQSVEDRLRMIVELIDRGFGGHLVLSHDEPIWAGLLTETDQERHKHAVPDSISYLPRIGLPALRGLGVTADQIHQLVVDNPRRWLTGDR